jgi:hypothetical protein
MKSATADTEIKMASDLRIRGQERCSTKVRFELWLTQENYDYLFQMAQNDGHTMSNMLNEMLRRLRLGQR